MTPHLGWAPQSAKGGPINRGQTLYVPTERLNGQRNMLVPGGKDGLGNVAARLRH